jgi:hypothetical protein
MGARVLLVAWKGSTATAWVEPLTDGGYTVLLEDTTGERAWRTAKERGIDVVIIDGEKKPSHGRQTGHALRDTAKTRDIPIIWTNLDQEDISAVQTEVRPDVTLPAPTDAVGTLAALQILGERVHFANGALFDAMDSAPSNGVVHNGHSGPGGQASAYPNDVPAKVITPEPARPPAKAASRRPARKKAKKAASKKTAAKRARAKTTVKTRRKSAR